MFRVTEPLELDDFLSWQPPKLVPIISDGLMYTGTRVIIYGKYKSLKSMLAIRFCVNVCRGKDWLGFQTEKSSVMYLQLEIPNQMLQVRMVKMISSKEPHEPFYIWTEPTIKIDTDLGYKRIEEALVKSKPKILVIDPIYKIMSGDMLETRHVQDLVDWIDKLIEKYQISVVLVHHSRKGYTAGGQDKDESFGNSDDMLGSVVFSAWADSIIKIERKKDKEILVRFDVVRHAERELSPRYFDVDIDTLDFKQNIGRKI